MKKKNAQTEAALVDRIPLRVRFSEVDSINVVWHGEYIRYFEDGREFFGEHYELTYLDVFDEGYVIPIVDVQCHYVQPLKVGEHAIIETRYINTDAAKILFEYTVYKASDNSVAAYGSTTQVFVRRDTNELELTTPEFYLNWKRKWKIIK